MSYRLHRPFVLLAAAAGGAALWTVTSVESPLPARSSDSGWQVGSDQDLDLLDDALEARLGLDPAAPDSDQDGLPDLEELLLGMDPLADDAHPGIAPAPSTYLDLYAVGEDLVVQVYGLKEHGTAWLSFHFGNPEFAVTRSMSQLGRWYLGFEEHPSIFPGWTIQMVRYRFPRAFFENEDTTTLAVKVDLDGETLASSTSLVMIDDILAQVRMFEASGAGAGGSHSEAQASHTLPFPFSGMDLSYDPGDGGGGTGGGLIPADPDDSGLPLSGSADEVCMQMLAPIGDLGGGRVLYQVVDAGCEVMSGGICFPSCAASVGELIVGFDPTGLIGG